MLSSVCFIFRSIFPPNLPTRVYIHCEARPRHIRQKLSVFSECPSLLRNISEIEIEREVLIDKQLIKPPVLNFRTTLILSAFLRNVPHMPQLHTAAFSGVKVKQEHLALLFQSISLHHLILFRCRLPKSVCLPPSPIRYLTLSMRSDCKLVGPLLGHCSANLETLDFTGQLTQLLGSTTLPLFPKLRKLRFEEAPGSISRLDILISLAPQLEHLEVDGQADFLSRLSALPASLNRFSIGRWMINDRDFGTRPFVHLPHLHITHYHHLTQSDHRGSIIPTIRRIFPNITSLDLDIKWDSRNLALLLARHLPNVTRLGLGISGHGVYDLDIGAHLKYFAEPRGPLASLYVYAKCASGFDMETYKSWVIHIVLGPNLGLGGPYLQEVEMIFDNSTRSLWLSTSGKGGCLQSMERKEERMFWVYSHGQVSEGPCIGDRDSL